MQRFSLRTMPLVFAMLWTFLPSRSAQAALSILTTTSDLKAIAQEVGGKEAEVEALCKGSQDPHYVEAKPSFMVKASRADLVIAIGLGLENAWLPSIIRGSRNPKIAANGKGYLEVGPLVKPLEVPEGRLTRADGDVHPEGNPHVTLDPLRSGDIALAIGKRLAELDPAHAALFQSRAEALKKRLEDKTRIWAQRLEKTGIKKLISFHKTLSYFLNRFELVQVAMLEPLPGIPPTAKHTLEVIARAKAEQVPLILVENFFDPTVAERVAKDVPKLKVLVVPVAVEGREGIQSLDDLYETLVRAIEEGKSHG